MLLLRVKLRPVLKQFMIFFCGLWSNNSEIAKTLVAWRSVWRK